MSFFFQFLEVKCRSSGKIRRFAQGTESRFALRVINSKLESGDPLALCIAAIKEGEEPIIFGPSAPLANYGDGWKLETLVNDGTTEPSFSDFYFCYFPFSFVHRVPVLRTFRSSLILLVD
jgi:hypothetical protein